MMARSIAWGGSSPLARGLRGRWRGGWPSWGIIPARAGFTSRRRGPTGRTRDHPRSRGVYRVGTEGKAALIGSSPLARGLRDTGLIRMKPCRIIPARAGFTSRRRTCHPGTADHPRSRGVYLGESRPPCPQHGSSPLARGLLLGLSSEWLTSRIIPARAGFTGTSRGRTLSPRDHPRSRGVYRFCPCRPWVVRGSSPLARGLPPGRWGRRSGGRIIPARAGFTPSAAPCTCARQDHPRSRGVYSDHGDRLEVGQGSSPLARGLPLLSMPTVGGEGIIPARAGFTDTAPLLLLATRDHPRSRGVYGGVYPGTRFRVGSSPLARGLRT